MASRSAKASRSTEIENRLVRPQGFDWCDRGRAPGGEPAGDERRCGNRQDGGGIARGIARRDAEQLTLKQPRCDARAGQPDDEPERGEPTTLTHDQRRHLPSSSAQREPDAELVPTACDGIRDYSVDA